MKTGRLRFGAALLVPLVLALWIVGCSDDDNKPTQPTDTTAPAAVSTLAHGTVTSSTVVLTWTAPGDDGSTGTAAQYDIRYATATITEANWASATQMSGEPAPAAAGTSQTFTATGLTANTPYYFAMKTADEVPNWSGLSNVVAAQTLPVTGDTTPPAAITNLGHGAVTATSVVLTWTAPGDDGTTGTAAQYDIRYSTSTITEANFAAATTVTGEPAPVAAGGSQQMTVAGLTPNTPYFFAIKAADEVPNWSDLSNVDEATTSPAADATPPSAITNLGHGAVTSTSVVLTWTAPGDDGTTGTAAQYDIRYSTTTITNANWESAIQVAGEPAPVAAGGSQQMTVTGLSPNTPYFFAMKTADEVPNWSALSNVDGATTSPAADTTPPAAITDLDRGTVTANSVVLTWTAPGDDGTTGTAAQYDIRYSLSTITEANFATATAVTGEPAPVAAGGSQQMTVTGLTAGTHYYFAMKTGDEIPNWSGISNVEDATTSELPDETPPAAIANLDHGAVTSTSVVLTWTAPGDDGATGTAAQYDIRYSTSTITEANFAAATAVTGEPAPVAAGGSQQMTVTGLSAGTPYFFAMKTADEVPNWSAISNVAEATTSPAPDATPPAAITDLAGVPTGVNSVELVWTAPGDDGTTGTATTYDIRYSTSLINEGNWGSATQVTGEPAPMVAGEVQNMTVDGLTEDTDYYFAMKTSDEVPNTSGLSNVPLAHTPSSEFIPEGLTPPDFPDSVCITSQDQWAQMAKLIAGSQLAIVKAYASLATAFFGPLAGADWQQQGDCWDYNYSAGGCTGNYHACKTGSIYEYTYTLNGSCYGETYSDWVAYRVVVDTDLRTGTFYIYQLNSTDIEVAWVWTWAADENSGGYTFYEGDPSSAPISAQLTWSRSADLNVYDMTYTVPEQSKWESHFVKDPCSGYFYSYQWDDSGPGWWKESEIVWNSDGTGHWYTYDDTGEISDSHEW